MPIYHVGEADGMPYFSMKYVEGKGLDRVNREEIARNPDRAAGLLQTIGRAVHFAHTRGILHRDLKPGNILIDEHGEPHMTDFGLAKRLDDQKGETRTGAVMGTPDYMAPEQAAGHVHLVSIASDVYSLGSILYDLLTGRPPFKSETVMQTLSRVVQEPAASPSTLNRQVGRDLETICLKCLEKDPAQRYKSAEELADDLGRYLNREPILGRPVGTAERLWRWCRRNPRVASLSAAVLLLLVMATVGSVLAAVWINREKDGAIASRERADQNAQTALVAQYRAEEAQRKADENAGIASAQRGLALDALNTLVTKVQQQLEDQPATHKLKQDLLETALTGLRKIASSAEGSSLADASMAEAHRRMGRIFELLGRTDEARGQYQQCNTILETLAENDPRHIQTRRSLAISYDLLGNVSLLLGDKTAAKDYYRKSLELRQGLPADDSQGSQTKVELATSYVKLGNVSRDLGEMLAAQNYYIQALALRKEVAVAEPRNSRAQRDLWVSYNMLAELRLRSDDFREARDHLAESLKLAQSLAALAPQSNRAKQDLAVSYEKLGNVDLRLGQTELAREHYGEALKLLRPLAAGDRQNLPVQSELAVVLARCGLHTEAAEAAGKLKELWPDNPDNLYNVACCYSLCVKAVTGGNSTGQSPSDAQALALRYADAAIEALDQAIDHGLNDLAYVQNDPDLEPIRRHPGYGALVKKMK